MPVLHVHQPKLGCMQLWPMCLQACCNACGRLTVQPTEWLLLRTEHDCQAATCKVTFLRNGSSAQQGICEYNTFALSQTNADAVCQNCVTAANAWCVQSHETGPELFVEVLGTLATAADAACGSSSNADGSDAAGDAGSNVGSCGSNGGGCGSSGPAPWQLMHGVTLQDVLAFLVGCFQQGAAMGLWGKPL